MKINNELVVVIFAFVDFMLTITALKRRLGDRQSRPCHLDTGLSINCFSMFVFCNSNV